MKNTLIGHPEETILLTVISTPQAEAIEEKINVIPILKIDQFKVFL